jgi:hypothetical protein
MSAAELFAEEFVCFYRYLHCVFHLRPKMAIHSAVVILENEEMALSAAYESDYVVLTADAIIPGIRKAHEARVVIKTDKSELVFDRLVQRDLHRDPFHALSSRVREHVMKRLPDLDILEVGSRDRADTKSTELGIRSGARSYTGVDIIPGPNVNVVCDVHRLSAALGDRRFDYVYSQNVFEHLLFPWQVVSEINRVLRINGEAFIITNHSIGLHDLPWDFWRFSDMAFVGLFNRQTGFEILGSALGEAVKLTPRRYHLGFIDHEGGVGFQAAAVWVKKTEDLYHKWPVDADRILASLSRPYPRELTDADTTPPPATS